MHRGGTAWVAWYAWLMCTGGSAGRGDLRDGRDVLGARCDGETGECLSVEEEECAPGWSGVGCEVCVADVYGRECGKGGCVVGTAEMKEG